MLKTNRMGSALRGVVIVLFLASLGYKAWLFYWCRSEASLKLSTHQNVLAIIRLNEHPDTRHLEAVTPSKTRWIQWSRTMRTDANGAYINDSDPVSQMLRAKGWRIFDQMGAGRVYKNANGERLKLATRMYTGQCQICVADRTP